MKTEAEAGKCWCPFARAGDGNNRCAIPGATGIGDDVVTCIASECMAWRWGEAAHWEGDTATMTPGPNVETVRRGYCGLAGKP